MAVVSVDRAGDRDDSGVAMASSVPAHIYRPKDMDAQPNGAAVIFVHGAGYLHNVGNFWSEYPREYMFNQYLASKGYVVLDLDYRASAGYGRDWRTAIYRYMGGRDLQDQVDASKYLTKEYQIDPGADRHLRRQLRRIHHADRAVHSAAVLRRGRGAPQRHRLGALQPRLHVAILNLPQTDTLAYRRSSPIYFAEGLKDPLLMLHGMVDTNVHFQDIVRLDAATDRARQDRTGSWRCIRLRITRSCGRRRGPTSTRESSRSSRRIFRRAFRQSLTRHDFAFRLSHPQHRARIARDPGRARLRPVPVAPAISASGGPANVAKAVRERENGVPLQQAGIEMLLTFGSSCRIECEPIFLVSLLKARF